MSVVALPLTARHMGWIDLRERLARRARELHFFAVASDAVNGTALLTIAEQFASLALSIPRHPGNSTAADSAMEMFNPGEKPLEYDEGFDGFHAIPGSRLQSTVTPIHSAISPPVHRSNECPGLTVLYVDDNPANFEPVSTLVGRRPDVRLLTAMRGDRVVEVARRSLPDVILMDIDSPTSGSFEVLFALRNDCDLACIPVIALSSNSAPRDIKRALDAGFFRYLIRPITTDRLVDALDMAFVFVLIVRPLANRPI